MIFQKVYPEKPLQPYIRHCWFFEINGEEVPSSQLFFPYGSHELIFYLQGNAQMRYPGTSEVFIQEKSFYTGQFTKPFELTFNEPCRCIGVSFYPWVGNLLYKIPSHKFTDLMVRMDCLEKGNCLFEQLNAAVNNTERFDLLEKYLERKFSEADADIISEAVARQIIQYPERIEVKKFVSAIGLSKRRIQQRFVESTGLPMSLFLRKVRFQKSVLLLRKQSREFNFTQLALEAGYYDQAHFINDFKEFSYTTPHEFVKKNSELKYFFKSLLPVIHT
jgi:AraC-like DNA-binding protein